MGNAGREQAARGAALGREHGTERRSMWVRTRGSTDNYNTFTGPNHMTAAA